MVKARFLRLALASCCVSAAPLAAAEEAPPAAAVTSSGDAAAARSLFDKGVEAVHREAWAEAEVAFEESARIVPRPSTLYNLALSRYRLERPVEALQAVDRLLHSADAADPGTREHAETLRQRALERVITVEVTVEPPDATITVDGTELSREPIPKRTLHLLPGEHAIIVSAPGRVAVRLELDGKAGQTMARSVALATQASAERQPPPRQPAPLVAEPDAVSGIPAHWILMGAGSLLLASAAVTGVMALKLDDDFMDKCPTKKGCDPQDRPLQERAKTFALATDVLLGLGLATGGVGAALYWRADTSAHRERALGVVFQGSL